MCTEGSADKDTIGKLLGDVLGEVEVSRDGVKDGLGVPIDVGETLGISLGTMYEAWLLPSTEGDVEPGKLGEILGSSILEEREGIAEGPVDGAREASTTPPVDDIEGLADALGVVEGMLDGATLGMLVESNPDG